MSNLKEIWIGILTNNIRDSGTDSPLAFILNQNGTDKVHHTIVDTSQRDLEKGEANLYKIPSTSFISPVDPNNLTDSSVRIGIRGSDMWGPEHIIVWGRSTDGKIQPLAFENDIKTKLSTDRNEGNLSIPLKTMALGDEKVSIRRLLVLMTTANKKDAGTNSPVELKIKCAGRYVVDYRFPDTPQNDQEKAQANLYFINEISEFTKEELDRRSIILEIKGDDKWLPGSFFIFGLESTKGRPKYMIPLVNIDSWNLGWLSTDSSEGKTTVLLPQA